MNNYEIRIVPHKDFDGNNYWYAYYPAVEACFGGGKTPEEAISNATESLNVMLDYLSEQKRPLPQEYKEVEYSGKISLRISKSTHQKVAEIAEDEGVSINCLLNNAVECYVGKKEYDKTLEKHIDELKDYCDYNIAEECKDAILKSFKESNKNNIFKGRQVYA